jgi:hypothetical protein
MLWATPLFQQPCCRLLLQIVGYGIGFKQSWNICFSASVRVTTPLRVFTACWAFFTSASLAGSATCAVFTTCLAVFFAERLQ